MKLLFIDPKCPFLYEEATLNTSAMGGTEATVVRLTKALAARHEVFVLQHNRTEVKTAASGAVYVPLAEADRYAKNSHHIVFVQKAQNIPALTQLAPKAKTWLWLHNFVPEETPLHWLDHLRHRLGIVCVSNTHAAHVKRYMRSHPISWATASWPMRSGVHVQYNPLDDLWQEDTGVARQSHKLVFFSSPHKGLAQVVEHFKKIHELDDRWHLCVADPGYYRHFDTEQLNHPAIERLGRMPPTEIKRHVQEAFCMFYPQTKQAETFGLVYAEANAVGTPVLAHDFGAAREILHPSNPPMNLGNAANVASALTDWAKLGPPKPSSRAEFSVGNVASSWERMLNAAS